MSAAVALAAAALAATTPEPASASCRDILVPQGGHAGRPVVEEDLARLRDVGSAVSATAGDQVFTISPDGRRAALQIQQGDPAGNKYCVAIVVVELRPAGRATVIDTGDELAMFTQAFRGREDYPFGFARTVTPRWSPDGTRVAYLKQAGGRLQAWEARADGTGARQATTLPEGVDDLRYLPDGSGLVLSSRPEAPSRRRALDIEGLTGFRYDGRFAPMARQLPFPPGPAPTRFSVVTWATGVPRPATRDEARLFVDDAIAGISQGTVTAESRDGAVAVLRPDADGLLERRHTLEVRRAGGPPVRCVAEVCGSRIVSLWWSHDGSRVEFNRREGDSGERSAFYSWRPGAATPKLTFVSSDLLFGCTAAWRLVACMRETSTRPRHLALLDTTKGRFQVAFDPNPEFASLRLGRVERFHLRDDYGAPFFADLVLPVGYERGRRYPLVVVQYESRGFLRGGTGDEYPIQALAGRGMAVLSVNRPPALAFAPGARTGDEINRANLKDFTLRRAVHSGIVKLIGTLVARGDVDPARVGLTGLSEGASEVQWALIHDGRFAATAMSGCCWGPQTMWLTGLVAAEEYRFKGYPSWADRQSDAFWRELSLVPNAARITTPTLIQGANEELLDAADAFTALQAAHAPVDLVIYPGERHVKWQPAHRLAVYKRNVEWFSFWLQGQGQHPDRALWESFRKGPMASSPRPTPDWSRPAPLSVQ